jgi:two-component system response regulator YesN
MYRLLVVDDEPDVLEGLQALLLGQEEIELDVHTAGSAAEALTQLNNERFDVVLSDICMPGMSGIDLLKAVRQNWPSCRVIFLSGHTEFNYIYEAEKLAAVSYILKTEDRRQIIAAIHKAIGLIEEQRRLSELESRLEQDKAALRPFLLHELMAGLVCGDMPHDREDLARLCPNLDPDKSFLLAVGRINGTDKPGPYEKARFHFALEDVLQRELEPRLASAIGETERWSLLFLLQSRQTDIDWTRLVQLARGSFEAVQTTCMEQLGIYLSLVICGTPVALDGIRAVYERLRQILHSEMSFGAGLKLIDRETTPAGPGGDESQAVAMVRSIIEQQYDRPLSLTKLAGQVYLNPSYLSRLFRRHTGMTLIACINQTRLQKARHLLSTTNMKVSDIAARCGFESPSYFNQAFKKAIGLAPMEYRTGRPG